MKKKEKLIGVNNSVLEKIKNNKAITLVALVVTIVVLIILATISINIIFGEEGIVERVRQAKQETANAQIEEQKILDNTANSIDGYVVGEREQITVDKEEYEELKRRVNGTVLWEDTENLTTINLSDDYTNYSALEIYLKYNDVHPIEKYDVDVINIGSIIVLGAQSISSGNAWTFVTQYTVTDTKTFTYKTSANYLHSGNNNSLYIRPYKIVGYE